MMTTNTVRRALLAGAAAFTLGAALAGCSSDSDSGGATTAAESVALVDAWAKAADSGMTAVFGTLTNSGDSTVTLTGVATDASARSELHEMASDGSGSMSMREKDGGFEVPARGARELEPGGEHLMLMDLTTPLRAGEQLALTLTFSDGSSIDVDAPIRDFSGAQENYSERSGESGHGVEFGHSGE